MNDDQSRLLIAKVDSIIGLLYDMLYAMNSWKNEDIRQHEERLEKISGKDVMA